MQPKRPMNLKKLFLDHPQSVGETYIEHMHAASGFGLRMVGAGFKCVVHSVLPFVWPRAASDCVLGLHRQLSRRRMHDLSARDLKLAFEAQIGEGI
jgi:uncharacterized protein DUF6356